ncbi:MAG: hypothetical protein MIO92_16555 [Methanosarcinaceae archaeon]|nr:hypothetical protein [Methanosarcinaceae archaeon]
MADSAQVHYIYPPNHDGGANPVPTRKVVVGMVGLSDGTGETSVVKVRLTDLMKHDGSTPTRTAVERIQGNIQGMTVVLAWDRALAAGIKMLGPGVYDLDFRGTGGIVDPGEDGDRTGNITLTSLYADSGDTYDLTLTVRLK